MLALRVILPAQYLLILIDWYGMFAVLIPVYAFLALPLAAALRGPVEGFVQRVAAAQWGLMVGVFCEPSACARPAGYSRLRERGVLSGGLGDLVVQLSDGDAVHLWQAVRSPPDCAAPVAVKDVEGFFGWYADGGRRGGAAARTDALRDGDCILDGIVARRAGICGGSDPVSGQARPGSQGLGATGAGDMGES